jgi:single-strand DNA-binding protein
MGRLTADPEYRQTTQGIPVCTFRIAVDRPYGSRNNNPNEPTADFFRVTAWRNTADFVSRYFTKGKPILVEGSIRNSNYNDSNGVAHYSTEIQASNVSFCLTDSKTNGNVGYGQGGYNNGYQNAYGSNSINSQTAFAPQFQSSNGFAPPQSQNSAPYQQRQQPIQPMQTMQSAPQVQSVPTPSATANQDLQVGQVDDFEEILSDGEIPF